MLAGLSGELAALGIAMLIPLIYTDALPAFHLTDLHILPPISRPSPPPDLVRVGPRTQSPHTQFDPSKLTAYIKMPDHAQPIIDPPSATNVSYDGPVIPGGMPYSGPGSTTGIPASIGTVPGPPVAEGKPKVLEAKPVEVAKAEPMRVSGGVQEARILNRVIPVYPALAKQARVQGVVELVGVIGRDGRVQQLRVLSGHPLLIPAAVEAVKQWTYRPTLLSGEPVEVVAPISVRFNLTQ